jgi:NAD(P) transhydrogenase subunit beta
VIPLLAVAERITGRWTDLLYLGAAVLFIYGLKRLSGPRTARNGNLLAALGMLVAIVVTLVKFEIVEWWVVVAGIVVGSAIGAVAAQRVQMTAMPQMVAIFNGFGGVASALVALAELTRGDVDLLPGETAVTIVLSIAIGSVTFSGSFIAFGKLQGIISGQPIIFRGTNAINGAIAAAMIAVGIWGIVSADAFVYWILAGLALVLGVLFVIPIGGADMPVVISLLNSFSGLAASAAGFVIQNNGLIVGGALVGAAGMILTLIMAEAMNRSLANIFFSGFGADVAAVTESGDRSVNRATPDDVAIALAYADSVMFVPGYGMAVAQAQHACRDLAGLLEAKGVTVEYAIHPVAGRMPGHMNVLLAEADVAYEQLLDLDQSNPKLPHTDVVVIIGANDVVNPAARDDSSSPIYGMPILEVDRAKTAVVIKRSLSPGFAGIDNPLFYLDNTLMFFSDAKGALESLISAVNEV